MNEISGKELTGNCENEIFDVEGIKLHVSRDHRFGSDAVELARFASPKKGSIICDLCTGCGIIPILLLKNRNVPKKIYALDIAPEAINLLRDTISDNKLDIIEPVLCDLKQTDSHILPREGMDMVTVNPPYFRTGSGKVRKSTAQATARHEINCGIYDVAAAASRLLKYGGYLKLCHIPERITDVIAALRTQRLEPKEIVFLHAENSNIPWLFLISAKKGGKPGARIVLRE